jgi:hypothetical protein
MIKSSVLGLIDKVLDKFAYQRISKHHLNNIKDFTVNILNHIEENEHEKGIASIVFSKDRAMQLHAFLSSYKFMVNEPGKMFILYRCTNAAHQNSYKQLISEFNDGQFIFVEEKDFRAQLIDIFENCNSEKIIFYVDDMIFTHKVDYNLLAKVNTKNYIVCLSRGKDLDYSVVLQKDLKLPTFTEYIDGYLQFKWNEIDEFSDWTYPLGVSAYLYSKVETIAMLKAIPFKAPNSLESNMQVFLPFYENRVGICPLNASCVCIHANLVQTEGFNPSLGVFSIEELLERWQNGQRINVNEFYGKQIDITQVQEYSFINVSK